MAAAPDRLDDAKRAAVLDSIGPLDRETAVACARLADSAAQACGCPIAAVALLERERERFVAARGLAVGELAREHALSAPAVEAEAASIVADASRDRRFAAHPLVAAPPGLRFIAALPLRIDGVAVGALCVADTAPRTLDAAASAALGACADAASELLRAARRIAALEHDKRRLGAKEALLDKLSDQLPGAVHQYRVDAAGRDSMPYTSAGMREFLGIDGERLAVQPALWLDRVLPEDRPALLASIEQSRRDLALWRHKYRIRRADGAVRWVLSGAMPEREADGATVWHGFTADVTGLKETDLALRRSEQRWAMAAAAAGIGVAELDLESGTLQFDRQACRNHGLPYPQQRLTFDDWLGMLVADERAGAAAALQRAIDGGTMEGRYRLHAPHGGVHWLEVVARTAESDSGSRIVIGTCRDVTVQHEAEQLRRDKQTAERANAAKTEFLSRVSHELRTPLNGILGFLQLMAIDRQHPLAPDQRRRLDGAQRSARHLHGMISDVLDVSRVGRDEFQLSLGSVDLQRAATAALAVVQPLAHGQGVQLPPPPGGPCWVIADPRALEQVLMNLLSNAIKYNRRGGAVRLDVDADEQRVRLAVVDQGAGLSDEQQRHLFEPFNRLGAERTRVEGTGLGLVITRQLVRAMNGALHVESRVGRGSRFTVELDAAATAGVDSVAAAFDTAPAPLAADQPPRRVVYIEDEPLNAVLMAEVFRGLPNWRLDIARDGNQGLALARDAAPDLLLVDMNLPDMSGIEIVRALRADPATAALRCIALSADAMRDQIETARAAGFDDYWTKPIDVRRMISMLVRALES